MRGFKGHVHPSIAVLGYSCVMMAVISYNIGYETLGHCHRLIFKYFHGIPKKVWYDNMKTVVVNRDAYSDGTQSG